MRQIEKVEIAGREISVKELTMAEIRQILSSMEKQKDQPHVIDLLFADMPAVAVSVSTGLTLKDLEGDFTQSDIKQLKDKVAELNPFFVKAMQRLAKIGQLMLEKN